MELTNKERYIKIFTFYVSRQGSVELKDMLDRTDFYIAPASKRYHCSYEEGLCIHSLNVFDAFINQLILKDLQQGSLLWPLLKKVQDLTPLADDELSLLNEGISKLLKEKVTLENIVISCLCHDFHKINLYKKIKKRVCNSDGIWEDKEVYADNEDMFTLGDDGTNSWYIANSCMKLQYCEVAAIENHMGFAKSGHPCPASGAVWGKSRLAAWLHICDMIATFDMEKRA